MLNRRQRRLKSRSHFLYLIKKVGLIQRQGHSRTAVVQPPCEHLGQREERATLGGISGSEINKM